MPQCGVKCRRCDSMCFILLHGIALRSFALHGCAILPSTAFPYTVTNYNARYSSVWNRAELYELVMGHTPCTESRLGDSKHAAATNTLSLM